jgi:hypothetical protein
MMLVISSVPAAAQTSGSESYDGTIVASGLSGTRVELASVIRFRGVFNGVGQVIERPSLSGDPDNTARDDLVFADGTIHLLTYFGNVLSLNLNPQSCTASGQMQTTSTVDGGTGIFGGATGSFDNIGGIQALAGRNPDGSCNFDLTMPPLHEIDTLSGSGSLSF